MELGFIGLGRMGANMVQRLLLGKHRVVAYNRTSEKTRDIAKKGAEAAFSLPELVEKLNTPRVVWVMVPAGDPVREVVDQLVPLLSPGDLIVDGGNSRYADSVRLSVDLGARRLRFLDVGTSGGIWGLEIGYCLMVGGENEDFKRIEPVLATLAPSPASTPKGSPFGDQAGGGVAPSNGYLHCGSAGAGHFVKMVHNGVEYGLMQAYAEGFEILKASPFRINLARVARLWNQGSVVRSWLLELAERALQKDPELAAIRGYVEDSGEGRWTVQQAIDTNVPAPVITSSLFARFISRQPESFAAKLLAALRSEFGGHAVKRK